MRTRHIPDWMAAGEPLSGAVCGADDDDDGGGGAGGGGDDKEKAAKDAQRLAFDAANAAVTKRLKSKEFTESLNAAVAKAMEGALAPISERLAKLGEAPAEQQAGGKAKDDPEKEALKARLKEMEDRQRKIEDERAQEVKAARASEERNVLAEHLRKAGVPDNRLRAAQALVIAELGAIGRDGDGRVVWRAQRDGFVDEMAVADGVKEFLGTDEGKAFLPPVEAKGSGNRGGQARAAGARGGQAGANGAGKMDKQQAVQVLTAALMHGGPGAEMPE